MAFTLTETEWVKAHQGTTVTLQTHPCQYKLATNYYKTLTFYIKRCVGVQFTHAPCVCSNDVSITYMCTCVWEIRGHPLVCLRTLLVFIYKQHSFIPVLVSDSFISWTLYLLLCQYSTNIPAGVHGVLLCLGYGCKAKSLDIWNALGTLLVLQEMLLLIFYLICSRKAPKLCCGQFQVGWFYSFWSRIFWLLFNKSVQTVAEYILIVSTQSNN